MRSCKHLATRLVRGWTHLERQKGGIGLRGPGETQLETDRRLLANRIKTLNARLDKVVTQRETTRRERKRAEIPTVALVGYTNAGKSTLFNRLTGAGAYAADQLFATLDPTVRRLELPDARFALLADTVGFVRDLPHELVAAFRSTLQEAREASVLLHVIDAADPNRSERIAQVNSVLSEVGAGSLPQIEVFNKTDLVGEPPRVETGELGNVRRVWLSAQTGQGTQLLIDAIGEFLGPGARAPAHRAEAGGGAGACAVLRRRRGARRAGAARRRRRPGGLDAAPGVRGPVPDRGPGAGSRAVRRENLCPPRAIPKIPRPCIAGVLTRSRCRQLAGGLALS